MALSDTAIRNTKPADKPIRLSDGGGMYLEVSPAGGKLWRMQYRFDGKRKMLAFGKYPAVSLADARARREDAKKLLANGQDPGAVKQAQKAARKVAMANSFEAAAREWFEVWQHGKAESHSSKVIARLENDVFPWLGKRPIAEITAPEVLSVLRRIESRGVIDTAQRAKESISMIMRYAIATGRRVDNDPCPSLRGALKTVRHSNFAALTSPEDVGELMRAIEGFQGTYPVRAALALAPLVFVRPGELRKARWADIDLEKGEWSYIVSKTKTEHLVPLARQAVEILRDLYPLTGGGEFCFPGRNPKKPMSPATINAALTRMGYDTQEEHTGHGFRAMARTLLAEKLRYSRDVIEHQLAHKVPDALGTAYNRTKFLDDRRPMMQEWADYLDELKNGAKVIPLRA